ncbi:MAG: DUF2294 domain-containing protein [Clostridiales bacterium]|nr:DUF2294 domain-containing protein [Clostridiales bacterium]MCF8023495.1 DUF2294 domain-containing protein [Clostridiales bacterium]
MEENKKNLKQELISINNEVNQEIFGRGLVKQKVYIMDNVILITAINHRVSALLTLDKQGISTREIDLILLDTYKTRLRQLVEERLNFNVLSVFKDYDPNEETSVNVLSLNENLKL